MNNFFEQFKKTARDIRLSAQEKQAMRVRLYEAMHASPLSAAHDVPLKPALGRPSPYFFFSPRWATALAVVLVMVLSSGTAFAAQGALPGDVLYAVKVNVNENIQTALATTPQQKAQVNASLAEERLQEAEMLAAQGKLDATTSSQLAANFDEHAQAAQTIADHLQTNDPAAAAQISTQFDSSLAAHAAILTELGDDSGSATTSADSNALAMHVRAHEHRENSAFAMSTTSTNANTFSAFNAPSRVSTSMGSSSPQAATASSSATTASRNETRTQNEQPVATSLESNAADALSQLQSDYQNAQSTLASSSISQIDARIAMIEAVQAAGAASLEAGDYAGAVQSFTQSLEMSTQLDTFITAGDKFNRQLLPSLLGTFGGGNSGGNSGDNTTDGNHGAGGRGDNSFHVGHN